MSEENNISSGLAKKWEKILKNSPEVKSEIESASTEELEEIIIKCEGNIYTVNQEIASDHKLNGAKELLKDLRQPYKNAKDFQMAKIQMCLVVLEQRGKDLDNRNNKE